MRIALFTDTYYPDLNGVSISVDNIAKELRKKGHTVFIFAPNIKGEYKDTDPDLIRLPSIKVMRKVEPQIHSPLPWFNKSFRRMFKEQYDIIHAHGNGPYSGLGLLVSKIKHVPFVMTFHTIHTLYTHYIFGGKIIRPRQVEIFLRVFANRCNTVLTVSQKMTDELIKYGYKKQIFVTPNFLDLKRFESLQKGFLHKLLDLPEDTFLVTTVARLGKEKNIDFLIRVFKKVYTKNPNIHFVIVGTGPEKENLQMYAAGLGIADRTHFTGKISYDDMPKVYKGSDIFAFSSVTESQGIVVLEAATAGTVAIVNDDPAFANMVINDKTGYVLPLSEDEFADKILFLYKNKKKRNQMAKAAREYSISEFDPRKITQNLLDIYKNTIVSYKKKK